MARRRRLLLSVTALVAAALGLLCDATGALRALELDSVDARFAIRSDDTVPRDVVVLALDNETFDKLHVRPPLLPRRLHARAIAALKAAGARTIAYDLEFTGQTTVTDDNALIRALRRAGNVVLATGGGNPLGSDATRRFARVRVGYAAYLGDRGDVLRRVDARFEGLPTFAAAASGRGRSAWIDYRGDVPVVSFHRALDGDLPDLRGKVVVVGHVNDLASRDYAATPVGTRWGAEINAIAIDTLLRGAPLREVSGWFLLVLLGVLVPLSALVLHGLRWLPVAGLGLVAWPVAAQLAFNGDRIVPFVPGAAALLAGGLGTLVVTYATELRVRRRLREQFGRFAPPSVVDAIVDQAGDEASLPGVRVEATVLFADLRSFTAVAERLGAEGVIALLNRYLGTMSDAILDHGGTVVSYMGDGIMAVFGAPLEQADHADRALAAARELLGPRLAAFNTEAGETFALGVGIASGPVMSGTVGSARRIEYATVGDTTNLAARLEGMTKGSPHALYVADSTRAALQRPTELVEVGELEVRGRSGRLRVWTLPE